MKKLIKYTVALTIAAFLFNNNTLSAQNNTNSESNLKMTASSNNSANTAIESIITFTKETKENITNDEITYVKVTTYDMYGKVLGQTFTQGTDNDKLSQGKSTISIENPYRIISKKIHLG